MRTKLGQMLESYPSLAFNVNPEDIAGPLRRLNAESLIAPTAMAIARVCAVVDAELKLYEDHYIKLCEKYGDKKPNGDGYQIRKDELEVFKAEVGSLLATLVSIPGERIKTGDLRAVRVVAVPGQRTVVSEGPINVSGSDLQRMSWLIE
jgi:hypothetical protein